MHGDVLELPAYEEGVQRPNVINANGDRPQVLNIRQPDPTGQSAGGYHRGDLMRSMKTTAGAAKGVRKRNNDKENIRPRIP